MDTTDLNADVFSNQVPSLLEHHYQHLINSGIAGSVITQRGYETVLGKKRLAELGFRKCQQHISGILIPQWGVDGKQVVGYQYRPDNPRLSNKGKPIKYESPAGSRNKIDCPPECQKSIGDPKTPLWITEGSKKADALASVDACVISINGVYGWRGENRFGGKTALVDFELIAWNDRQVFLAPDSDITSNHNVRQATERLGALLSSKGSEVHIVYLTESQHGKVGVDDYLAKGHTIEEVKSLAKPLDTRNIEIEESFVAHFEYNGALYLEVRRKSYGYCFAHLENNNKVALIESVSDGNKTIKLECTPLELDQGISYS